MPLSSDREAESWSQSVVYECSGSGHSHRARLHTLTQRDRTRASQYRGVHFAPTRRLPHRARWSSAICEQGKLTHLGTYDDEWRAAVAYDFALMILNHPPQNFLEQAYRDADPATLWPMLLNVERRLGRTLNPHIPRTP
jgi:hypothetical protein